MSTHTSYACTTGFAADRELSAAVSLPGGRGTSPIERGQKLLSLVQELPLE